MEVWKLLLVLLLYSTSRVQDTVAADIGHQVDRLVMLLTLKECEDLVMALSISEEDILNRLEGVAPETNKLTLQLLNKINLSSAEENEAQCRMALTLWLNEHGLESYNDRLTRALQHIGRTDIAMEVEKNINQENLLNLKRYVEDYHKIVSAFNMPEEPAEPSNSKHVRRLRMSDLRSEDLEVRVWRAPVSLYSKGPTDMFMPVLWGLALGFFGTLLALLCICFTGKYFNLFPKD